jgi:anti-sigma regulatory factor (Ser/Thr protein kinase)
MYHHTGTSPRDVERLKDFAAMRKLREPAPCGADARDRKRRNGSGLRFFCDPAERFVAPEDGAGAADVAYYRICANGLDGAVENINKVVAIVGTSLDLDPRSTLQLRLCVYELSTNTAEHGVFASGPCSIDVELFFGRSSVRVVYRDNSERFSTHGPGDSRIVGRNISTGRKRGLGLYMINRLCSDLSYRRIDGWNTSSFILETDKNTLAVKKEEQS